MAADQITSAGKKKYIYPGFFVVNVGFYDLNDSTRVTNVLIHTPPHNGICKKL